MHSLLLRISSELSNIRKQLNAESIKANTIKIIVAVNASENPNDVLLADKNLKTLNEGDEDFIGALQDIQVCIL